jgi:lipopolysaccharide biosynthesis regulator YciM
MPLIQTTHCISIIGMSKVMGLVVDDVVPTNVDFPLPKTREGAQCIKNQVGCDYDVIHTCMCDKCLYHKQIEYFFHCPKCGMSSYHDNPIKKCIPRKLSYYLKFISLIPFGL